jgi:hypothetical protein
LPARSLQLAKAKRRFGKRGRWQVAALPERVPGPASLAGAPVFAGAGSGSWFSRSGSDGLASLLGDFLPADAILTRGGFRCAGRWCDGGVCWLRLAGLCAAVAVVPVQSRSGHLSPQVTCSVGGGGRRWTASQDSRQAKPATIKCTTLPGPGTITISKRQVAFQTGR